MKKNLEIIEKTEILCFPQSNPVFEMLIRLRSRALAERETRHGYEVQSRRRQVLLPFQNGGQMRRKTISYWTQAKIIARCKKVVSTVVFFISLSLYGNSIPPKYSIFIQKPNLFNFRKNFPETREIDRMSRDREKWQKIARLTAEPWELAGL